MKSALEKFKKFFQSLLKLKGKPRFLVFILLFLAIPLTVFATLSFRSFQSKASTGSIVNICPDVGYNTCSNPFNTTNPAFSWACYCVPAGGFAVQVRLGDTNFDNGLWQTVVGPYTQKAYWSNGTAGQTNFVGKNGYPSAPANLPGQQLVYWRVIACDNIFACSFSSIGFWYSDNLPPTLNINYPTTNGVYAHTPSSAYLPIQYYVDDNNAAGGVYGSVVYVDGVRICNNGALRGNFTCNWRFGADGTHYLTITATDESFNTAYKQIRFSVISDTDGDGFFDYLEKKIGTNPLASCGVNAWPPDFNNDGVVNVVDLQMFATHYNTSVGQAGYSTRFDLNADGKIDQADFNVLNQYYFKHC